VALRAGAWLEANGAWEPEPRRSLPVEQPAEWPQPTVADLRGPVVGVEAGSPAAQLKLPGS
jgi:hypothetical protein